MSMKFATGAGGGAFLVCWANRPRPENRKYPQTSKRRAWHVREEEI
jgi:hypothetical protein